MHVGYILLSYWGGGGVRGLVTGCVNKKDLEVWAFIYKRINGNGHTLFPKSSNTLRLCCQNLT